MTSNVGRRNPFSCRSKTSFTNFTPGQHPFLELCFRPYSGNKNVFRNWKSNYRVCKEQVGHFSPIYVVDILTKWPNKNVNVLSICTILYIPNYMDIRTNVLSALFAPPFKTQPVVFSVPDTD